MVKIICDRCKREISGKPRYIVFGVKDDTEGETETSRESDYCEKCIEEIKAFIARESAPAGQTSKIFEDCDYCERCMEEMEESITHREALLTHQTVAGQTDKRPNKRNTRIDMGKVNALRETGWSIGKIAEEMRIPPEEIAEKIFDRKVQDQKSAKA